MQVSTIIVSYNTCDLTERAVISALESSPMLQHEVIVVDNNSPDESGERLRKRFADRDEVRIIQAGDNRGFSVANNIGASSASGEVLFFLNPDTVVETGAVETLYQFVKSHSDAGAVGPHVLNADGTDQASVTSFLTVSRLVRNHLPFRALFNRSVGRNDVTPSASCPVDIVKGCALAVTRAAYDRVGGWDESYFMYAEERELCYALRRLEYQNFFVREARIVHLGGASTGQGLDPEAMLVHQRSSLQFLSRHHGRGVILLHRLLGAFGFGVRGILFPFLAAIYRNPELAARGRVARRIFSWYVREFSTET